VCLYFLVSTVVILSNSSGGALRVLDAAAILGIFAALAVPGYVLLQRGEYDPLGVCVMIAAGGAGLLLVISSFAGNAGFAKFSAVIGGVSLVGTQTALLLFMKANKQWFRYAQYAAIGVAWLAGLVAAITVLRATNTSTLTGSVTGLAALGKATGIFIIMDICASVVAILLWRLALKYGG